MKIVMYVSIAIVVVAVSFFVYKSINEKSKYSK